jgi:hypothetical protein
MQRIVGAFDARRARQRLRNPQNRRHHSSLTQTRSFAMSTFDSKTKYQLIVGLVLAASPLLSAHAEYRCDAPQAGVHARACAAAAQGPTELRRFVERTRMIYGLSYWDYARPETDPLAAKPSSNQAKAAILSDHHERPATLR